MAMSESYSNPPFHQRIFGFIVQAHHCAKFTVNFTVKEVPHYHRPGLMRAIGEANIVKRAVSTKIFDACGEVGR